MYDAADEKQPAPPVFDTDKVLEAKRACSEYLAKILSETRLTMFEHNQIGTSLRCLNDDPEALQAVIDSIPRSKAQR